MTARRRALSPRGRPPTGARGDAGAILRAGYLEAALGAVGGSVVGGWAGEFVGSQLAASGNPDNPSAGPLLLGIAGGLWLGATIGAVAALLVRRRTLAWPTAIGLLVAWPALASATGVLQTLAGMGPSFLPYVLSTLVAGIVARAAVLRVFTQD